MTIRDYLASLPLFSEIALDEMDRIAAHTTEMQVLSGDMVFRQGDPSTGIHLLVSGQVKLSLLSPSGNEKVVQLVDPGHSFGEALMFLEKPYIVSAQALNNSLLLHVAKEAVFEQIERNPRFARTMLAGLSRRLHLLMKDVESYSQRSATQRLIGYLLRDDDDAAPSASVPRSITLPTYKGIIASRLNLSQEHFSRTLRELTEKGLIQVSGRVITVLDIEKLRAYGA
jgi:CRP/FNR family transcriptional regulator, dissimilatory nitrate respiration regulator